MSTIYDYLADSIKQNTLQKVSNANHPFPCGICHKNVNNNQKSILCTGCDHWIHIKCNGTPLEEYNAMIDAISQLTQDEIDSIEWLCNKCLILKTSKLFPFGLEEPKFVECYAI